MPSLKKTLVPASWVVLLLVLAPVLVLVRVLLRGLNHRHPPARFATRSALGLKRPSSRWRGLKHLSSSISDYPEIDISPTHLRFLNFLLFPLGSLHQPCLPRTEPAPLFQPSSTAPTMPTPSSNPPPDQSSPPPYSFSSCPEDQPHGSRSSRPTQDTTRPTSDMETSQSSSSSIASTAYSSAAARDGPAAEEAVFIDGRASVGVSPIDTTSPRPPSSGTSATSPTLSGRDDSLKHQGTDTSDRLSRESSTVSGHSHVENPIPVRREPDALEWYEEDAYGSPAMPSDCTNLRVRIPLL